MTLPLSRQRFQVAIPAQGMIEIRDALTDLLNEFGTDDHGSIMVDIISTLVKDKLLILIYI